MEYQPQQPRITGSRPNYHMCPEDCLISLETGQYELPRQNLEARGAHLPRSEEAVPTSSTD